MKITVLPSRLKLVRIVLFAIVINYSLSVKNYITLETNKLHSKITRNKLKFEITVSAPEFNQPTAAIVSVNKHSSRTGTLNLYELLIYLVIIDNLIGCLPL